MGKPLAVLPQVPLETYQPTPDRRVIRAARSLYVNQQRRGVVEARIDRATAELSTYFGLYGLATAIIGGFHVGWDGEQLTLERLPSYPATQLPLPQVGDDDRLSPSQALEAVIDLAAGDDVLPDQFREPLEVLRLRAAGEGGEVSG